MTGGNSVGDGTPLVPFPCDTLIGARRGRFILARAWGLKDPLALTGLVHSVRLFVLPSDTRAFRGATIF